MSKKLIAANVKMGFGEISINLNSAKMRLRYDRYRGFGLHGNSGRNYYHALIGKIFFLARKGHYVGQIRGGNV